MVAAAWATYAVGPEHPLEVAVRAHFVREQRQCFANTSRVLNHHSNPQINTPGSGGAPKRRSVPPDRSSLTKHLVGHREWDWTLSSMATFIGLINYFRDDHSLPGWHYCRRADE